MSEVKYLFIDGSYLRKALQALSEIYFDGEQIELNLQGLFEGYRKSFYYDCLPSRKVGESENDYVERIKPQQEFLQQVRSQAGVHVIEGVIKGQEKRSRQKKIDVSIAVDMLTHAYRHNMDQTTLLAGDLDFEPLVKALVDAGMYVTIWYEETSASKELIYAADDRRKLSIESVYKIAGNELIKKYPPPVHGTRPIEEKSRILLKGSSKNFKINLYLYKENDRFEIVTRSTDGSSYEGFLSHQNLDYLLKYADFEWGKCEWEKNGTTS